MTTAVRPKEFHFPLTVEWTGGRRVAARVDGKDAALLALQPGADGKALAESVKDVSGPAKDARDQLKKAVADAKKVRDALKDTRTAAKG